MDSSPSHTYRNQRISRKMRAYPLLFLMAVATTSCAPKTELSSASESREFREPSIAIARAAVREEAKSTSVSEAVSETPVEAAVIAASANGKLRVTVLPLEIQEKLSACACTFSPNGDGSIFLTGWLDPSEGAWMQINGSTENFTIDGERNQRASGKHGRPEVGDKTTYNLSNTKYRSDLVCKISNTCWESSECESISYECAVTVRSMDTTVTVPATGMCGC